ncbi:MAG TPA: class I SAM-dependent methyltransferase [Kofleriaceae bacterium]|nr:class I SAM-dependent methyltransferase [Kofleriaceae bacterium]
MVAASPPLLTMLRELVHFARHAPATLRLKRALPQAELYDRLCGAGDSAGMSEWRSRLVADLTGDILEIGAGTGLMFPHYRAGARVTALEPDAAFAALAAPRVAAAAANITIVSGTAEALPGPSRSRDGAVVGLVLCSVPNPVAALGELARVLRPGAPLRLVEHVRSPHAVAGVLMRAANPLWLALNAQGCNMHRDPLPAIREAGFLVERVEPFQIFTPGIPAFPMRAIWARAAG